MDQTEFPHDLDIWKFCPAIIVGSFTMNLTDGLTDRTDDGHTDGWTDFQVESHLG